MIDIKKILATIIGIIAIIAGIYTIFKISPTKDFAINFLTVSFGLLALIWAFKAYRSLAPNSSLRSYALLFALALTFIVMHRVLIVISIFLTFGAWYNYLNYLIIVIGYLLFVASSYKILAIGKEFGFAESTIIIKEALKDKKKKK